MDQIEHVKKLREEYERALDAAESRRSAYHDAVLALYQGGTPLREIAKDLGLSHQRVHQIVSAEPPSRSKLPRAAGGAAAMALVVVAATFGVLRLMHAPPFEQRTTAPPRVALAFRDRHGFKPGGAVLRRKHEVVARATPIGDISLWVAPDRVSHSGRCSWLQLGKNGLGGSCYQAPQRGLPQVVPAVFHGSSPPAGPSGPSGPSGPASTRMQTAGLLLIWGRTGPGVDHVTLAFRDGARMSVSARDGMFLIAGRVLQTRWRNGHRPSLLIAHDATGRIVDERPVRLDLAASF